jgi:hypothetical protein
MTRGGATSVANQQYKEYFKPMWRWSDAMQNDFAARADWCVKPISETNHPPVVILKNDLNITAKPGEEVELNAAGTYDPDKDKLSFTWWQYEEADTYPGKVTIRNETARKASLSFPADMEAGQTIHIVCEVKDNGTPELKRYKRIILRVSP